MGRKKKYVTEEQKKEANRRDFKRWYEKNKEKLNVQRMKSYYEQKSLNTTIYRKKCPVCSDTQLYATEVLLTNAIKNNKKCRSCSKKGLIPWNKGGQLSNEHRESIRISKTGNNHHMYGKKHSNEAKKNMRLSAIKRITNSKSNATQFFPNYNPNSISIIEQKAKELGITDLQHAENGGEYYIKELGFWVDGYSKEKNVVIEYYENSHKFKTQKDLQRQNEIMNLIGCTFIIIQE